MEWLLTPSLFLDNTDSGLFKTETKEQIDCNVKPISRCALRCKNFNQL